MEEVFDFRSFVMGIVRRWKALCIPLVVFGLLGGAFGYARASMAGEQQPSYTATAAAAVNLVDAGEIPYWTLSGVMATVEAVSASDFTYANFADELADQGLSQIVGESADPSIDEIKQSIRFYIRGNLLLAEVTSHSQELSTQASQAGVTYLSEVLPELISHISVEPLDRQTVSMAVTPAPSKLRKAVKFGALGGAGGLVLGLLWIFCVDVFDPRAQSRRDLTRYGLPVLGAGAKADRVRRAAIGLLGALKEQPRPLVMGIVSESGAPVPAQELAQALKSLGEDAVCADPPQAVTAESAKQAVQSLREAHSLTLLPLREDADLLLMSTDCTLLTVHPGTRTDGISQSLDLLRSLASAPVALLLE